MPEHFGMLWVSQADYSGWSLLPDGISSQVQAWHSIHSPPLCAAVCLDAAKDMNRPRDELRLLPRPV